MDIHNRRAVRAAASEALRANPGKPRKLALTYIAAIAGSTLLVSLLSIILNNRINATGGLGDLGLRSVLVTIQFCLPVAQILSLLFMHLGYQKATVAIARHQAVHPRDLRQGFRFFGPLLRVTLMQGLIYLMMDFITSTVASYLFMLTPFFADYAAASENLFNNATILNNAMVVDTELLFQFYLKMLPMFCIWVPLFCITALPFFYNCRMINYVLAERPGTGALMAMGESGRMMLGNRMTLFKYDLRYWWYHLPRFLLSAFIFSSVLLILMDFPQSLTESAIICGIIAVCLLLMGLLHFFFLNKVETTYATIYNALRPQPQEKSGGAVLGNIFDLAREYKED